MKLNEKALSTNLYYRLCGFVLFFVTAAASFNGFYDSSRLYDTSEGSTHGRASFEAEMDGTDARPFVYRQMLPAFANAIDEHISQQTKDRLYNLKGRTGVTFRERIIDSPIAQDRTYFLRYWILYAVVFLFTLSSIYSMYMVGKAAGFHPAAAAIAAMAIILLLPYFQDRKGHMYDYPELTFIMFAVWIAMKFDWWWLVPLTALATWNKESFLFFIPALYPFIRERVSRVQATAAMGALALISTAVYYAIRERFRHNPGTTAEYHLLDHIHSLHLIFNPMHMIMVKNYGVWAPPAESLITFVLLAWTVWRVWPSLTQAIQRHIQIATIINIPLFLLLGVPFELRALAPLYVTLLFLLAASLTVWIHSSSLGIERRISTNS